MTTFETEVYDKDDGNIIGAQVIVSSEGDIDSIDIVDKTALDALTARLDVLDETYVQFEDDSSLAGSTIDELLENTEEDVPINATTLSGFASDSFSKTGHTHSKSDITNLLEYTISSSQYNVDIGDEVSIRVSVTDMANRPVANSPVVLNLDGDVIASGGTNSMGIFVYTHTLNDVGLHTFSVKNQSTFVNVGIPKPTIQKATVITGKCDVYYEPNLKLCQVLVNGSFSISSTGSLGTNVLSNFKPKITMPMAVFTTGMNISIADSTGNIAYVNNSGSTGSKTVVASATYFYD